MSYTEKKHIDEVLGEVTLRRSSRSRRYSIRVVPDKGVIVTIPWLGSYRKGLAYLVSMREWVLKNLKRQAREPSPAEGMSQEEKAQLVEKMRKEAKNTLVPRLRELADRYGFSPGRVTIKHNSSNWGSCSRLGNINLNLNLVRVPEPCMDYVILHELCHLRHLDHGKAFHTLLNSLLADLLGEGWTTARCRRELKKYTLI